VKPLIQEKERRTGKRELKLPAYSFNSNMKQFFGRKY
jgi:hypothetical protein